MHIYTQKQREKTNNMHQNLKERNSTDTQEM